MTAVELLLSLAVTSMVAAAVISMLSVVSSGAESRDRMRRDNTRTEVITHRLDSAIRSSTKVLAADEDMLVLWTGDRRQNQMPNLSELLRIQWDADSQTIRAYAAAADLPEVDDAAFALSGDFDSLTVTLIAAGDLLEQTWADGVLAWEPGPPDINRSTRLLRYTLTLDSPDGPRTTTSTMALRGQ